MVMAVVVGTRLYRPSRPLAWFLLAAGPLFTAGDAINYTYQWVFQVEPPYPSSPMSSTWLLSAAGGWAAAAGP